MSNSQNVYCSIGIRNFPPATAGKKVLQRKKELRDTIKNKIGEKKLQKIRDRCRGKHLFLNITYRLLKTDDEGRSQKDLDNLIKILFDVFQDYITNHSKDKEFEGLGLIENDKDIFKICCEKKLTDSPSDEGFDLMVSIMD